MTLKNIVREYLQETGESYTVFELAHNLDMKDEKALTIALHSLERERLVFESEYKEIFREDGGVILLPCFKYSQ